MARTNGQKLSQTLRFAALTLAFALPAAPAAGQDFAAQENRDPFIGVNQVIFGFNEYFDNLLLRPLAVGYFNYVPPPVQTGVTNFFGNIDDLNTMANNLLQWKIPEAVSDCGRILINTTVGIGGLIDVASELGLEKHNEDFGQTLGVWGIESGPYLVLPIFGASSTRDAFGLFVDSLLNPIYQIEDEATRVTTFGAERLEWRTGLLPAESLITGDRYLFLREASFQQREFEINDGELDDPFGDF